MSLESFFSKEREKRISMKGPRKVNQGRSKEGNWGTGNEENPSCRNFL